VGGERWTATAFEVQNHDALYRDAGLCIDLDRDEECDEDREVFYDGDSVPFPEGAPRLLLTYP
jgi:hypothetical protein